MFYSLLARLLTPVLWWGRARVAGVEVVPANGPLLLVPNHDSQWDPIVVALALRHRRKLRFLARANLWKVPGLGPLLYALHQIPVARGAGDGAAIEEAVTALRDGEPICVFPEGRLSLGERVRAHSGVGRLAAAVPEAQIVCCSVAGATDYVRFPRRPRVRVEFFAPTGGGLEAGESLAEFATGLIDEIRDRVPPAPAGRDPEKAEKRLRERNPAYRPE